jgi:hypothetical protein
MSVKKVKSQQSLNRPGVAQRVPGGLGSHISMTSPHEGGEFISLTHRPPLPEGDIPGAHFRKGLSRPQGHGAVGGKYVTEKSSDTTGNRSRDRPTNSASP